MGRPRVHTKDSFCEIHQCSFRAYPSNTIYVTWMCQGCIAQKKHDRLAGTELGRQYSLNTRVKRSAKQKQRYAEDSDWRDKIKAQSKAWREANRSKRTLQTTRRRALQAGAEGEFTLDEWHDVCEEYDYKCIDCGIEFQLTIGHAIPLTKGGSNWIDNIIPQCFSCNSKQHNSIHPSVSMKTLEVNRSYYGYAA